MSYPLGVVAVMMLVIPGVVWWYLNSKVVHTSSLVNLPHLVLPPLGNVQVHPVEPSYPMCRIAMINGYPAKSSQIVFGGEPTLLAQSCVSKDKDIYRYRYSVKNISSSPIKYFFRIGPQTQMGGPALLPPGEDAFFEKDWISPPREVQTEISFGDNAKAIIQAIVPSEEK
jgi:hypothetical protein